MSKDEIEFAVWAFVLLASFFICGLLIGREIGYMRGYVKGSTEARTKMAFDDAVKSLERLL